MEEIALKVQMFKLIILIDKNHQLVSHLHLEGWHVEIVILMTIQAVIADLINFKIQPLTLSIYLTID